MAKDETTEESVDTETTEDSSTETTDAKEEEEETSKEEEEPKIPLSRLRKETAKRKEAERRAEEAEKKPEEVKPEGKEGEAKAYLQKMINETLDERDKKKDAEKTAQDTVFEATLEEIVETYPKLDKKGFKKFYSKGKFEDSVDGMWGAAKIFSDMEKSKPETTGRKPKMPEGKKTSDKVKEEPVDLEKDIQTIKKEAIEKGKAEGKI